MKKLFLTYLFCIIGFSSLAGEIDGKGVFCKDTVYRKNIWEAIYFEDNHAINLVTKEKFRYSLKGHYVFWDNFRLDRRILELTKGTNYLKLNFIFYDSYLWCDNPADVNTVVRKYNEAIKEYKKTFKF
jgi:hypothetical protein